MENHKYSAIIGSTGAQYVNQLATECGLATDYSAVSHPSLPNYLALTSGSTQGVTSDENPGKHTISASSVFSQVPSWRSLDEAMPSSCYKSDSGEYEAHHNPALYYAGVSGQCSSLDVPLGAAPDLSAAYTFVTPDACDDMEDCTVQVGDAWLKGFMASVFATSQWRSGTTVVFVTWDEGTQADNQVATLVVAPTVVPGTRVGTPFSHYSLLRTTEDLLGQHCLANACSATSMVAGFRL